MKARIGWRSLARFFAGESSAEEAAAIRAWGEADRRHAELLEVTRRAWEAAEPDARKWNVDAAWHAVAQRMQSGETVIPITQARRARSRVWLWPVAAAAVLFLVATPFVWREAFGPSDETTYTTAAGEQRMIRLADGSVARLAESSQLRVSRTRPRTVTLQGTAFFGITERAEPFVVTTDAGEARVLGTRFELNAEGPRMRLAVLEGRVALLSEAGGEQVVDAGQVSSVESGDAPSAPRRTDVQKLINWMGRVLIFQDTPLPQATQEIERLYGIDARISGASLKDRTVTATFENENLSTVITTLCRVVDAKCDVQDKVVRIRE